MANLKTDSPLSRRIVRAFFDFLDSVQPAPGVDLEGLDVARECLNEVFKIDSTAADDSIKPGLLIDLFRSLDGNADQKINSDLSRGPTPVNSPNLSHAQNVGDVNLSLESHKQGDDWMGPSYTMGESKDELFGQFCAALEKIHFFKTTPDGNDDPVQLDKATRLFHDALNAMEKAGCQSFNRNSLAETLKSQAAYTQIHKYTEAIRDCLKSIEIDPHYSKAYSRLGLAYYAQGNYRDAIDKGFRKALELDPHNESVKENIRVAEQKLKEEQQWTGRDQMNFSGQEPNNEFTSMPFNMNGIPVDFANMFRNMAAQFTGEHPQERQGEDRNVNGSEDPEVRLGGNINLNLGENVPEELRGALRSMMGMFSGAATHGNPQPQDTNTTDGRSPPN